MRSLPPGSGQFTDTTLPGFMVVSGAQRMLPGQLDDIGGQPFFIVTAPRDLALRRTVLSQRRTGAALGDRQHTANVLDAGAPTRGAQ